MKHVDKSLWSSSFVSVLNILEPEHTFWWDNLIMCWVVKSSVAVAKKWFFKIQLVHDSWMGPSHCMYRAKYFPAGTGAMVGFRDVVQTANLQAAQIAKVPVILHWFLKSCRLFSVPVQLAFGLKMPTPLCFCPSGVTQLFGIAKEVIHQPLIPSSCQRHREKHLSFRISPSWEASCHTANTKNNSGFMNDSHLNLIILEAKRTVAIFKLLTHLGVLVTSESEENLIVLGLVERRETWL